MCDINVGVCSHVMFKLLLCYLPLETPAWHCKNIFTGPHYSDRHTSPVKSSFSGAFKKLLWVSASAELLLWPQQLAIMLYYLVGILIQMWCWAWTWWLYDRTHCLFTKDEVFRIGWWRMNMCLDDNEDDCEDDVCRLGCSLEPFGLRTAPSRLWGVGTTRNM